MMAEHMEPDSLRGLVEKVKAMNVNGQRQLFDFSKMECPASHAAMASAMETH
jgi:hypothetical protein